jgi:rfaE bifunctional protein nucleotidyltransferase chain/domain
MSRLSFIEEKICNKEQAIQKAELWKFKGQKIVFTNGCFDILHKGHVTYLAKAAALGDKLIVALNTDSSVKRLGKGTERPINSEDARLFVLASLSCVDMVLLFDENTPLEIIKEIKPSVLAKGSDYDPEITDENHKKYIVGSDFVKQNGGVVKAISLVDGFSTTNIINKIQS